MILLAIILLPLKYPFWINSKLRQFSHFLQQINKSVPNHFQKSKRELRVYFRSFVAQISINRKLRSNMTGKLSRENGNPGNVPDFVDLIDWSGHVERKSFGQGTL